MKIPPWLPLVAIGGIALVASRSSSSTPNPAGAATRTPTVAAIPSSATLVEAPHPLTKLVEQAD